ncbi:MAG: DNA topoisomerase IV subunit A [Burkholderiales bacterium]|nr:DNA topoisomerase IV subunit A [Burkholderiales bacterium]
MPAAAAAPDAPAGAGGGGAGEPPHAGGPLPPLPDADYLPLALYAERAYLDYAVSVVKGRALPDVADGQKPVQRRIVFAMHEMGLAANAKPVKSARVVGDVLGKFHPHGDQSAYDAMVRLAQDFSLRYPLIDGQGNFGSRDGDGAAAMRYTEARLTPIARLLLDEIDMGTVDFVPNYDGSMQEPKRLPARLPMLLLNGASGIAVGMATEVPPHNLREVARAAVALIRKPRCSDAELLEHLAGPDFPGGGQVISSRAEIADAYASGRGSLKVRARWSVEELARGQWQVVVNELPPGSSAQKVLEEIEELTNPKVRAGKKSLSPEQQNLKALVLSVLDTVRDESGKDAAVRLVFEPRTSKVDQAEFMNVLLAHTSMESSVSINMVTVGLDGRPRQKSLRDLLSEWTAFRFDTVTRRTRHRLGKVDERIHILEGRLIVLLNIDKVIRIIRESDEPKPALIGAFRLSERQAEDILEIRLRQLARLEGIRIEQELKELKAEKADLEQVLADETVLRKLVIREIEGDAKLYGDARRTLIEEAGRSVVTQAVPDEPVTVIFSEKGWVRARSGHGHDASLFGFKEGDALYGAFECRTVDQAILIGSNGRVYSVPVAQLPGARGDGVPVTTLIDLEAGTRILHMLAGAAETRVLLASSSGHGFVCKVGDMVSRVKGGKAFLRIDEKSEPLRPALVAAAQTRAAVMGTGQRLLVMPLEEIGALSGGGRGVILMELDLKERLLAACTVGDGGIVIEGAGRGGKEFNITLDLRALRPYEGRRARKGKLLVDKIKAAGMRSVGAP